VRVLPQAESDELLVLCGKPGLSWVAQKGQHGEADCLVLCDWNPPQGLSPGMPTLLCLMYIGGLSELDKTCDVMR